MPKFDLLDPGEQQGIPFSDLFSARTNWKKWQVQDSHTIKVYGVGGEGPCSTSSVTLTPPSPFHLPPSLISYLLFLLPHVWCVGIMPTPDLQQYTFTMESVMAMKRVSKEPGNEDEAPNSSEHMTCSCSWHSPLPVLGPVHNWNAPRIADLSEADDPLHIKWKTEKEVWNGRAQLHCLVSLLSGLQQCKDVGA